jgi:ABC-type spermidine/putrescine transport system permease subunit II
VGLKKSHILTEKIWSTLPGFIFLPLLYCFFFSFQKAAKENKLGFEINNKVLAWYSKIISDM